MKVFLPQVHLGKLFSLLKLSLNGVLDGWMVGWRGNKRNESGDCHCLFFRSWKGNFFNQQQKKSLINLNLSLKSFWWFFGSFFLYFFCTILSLFCFFNSRFKILLLYLLLHPATHRLKGRETTNERDGKMKPKLNLKSSMDQRRALHKLSLPEVKSLFLSVQLEGQRWAGVWEWNDDEETQTFA